MEYILGGAAAVVAAPILLPAMGFTAFGGVLAPLLPSQMVALAPVLSGGGVPAGGMVALLQSAGAAGISEAGNAALAAVWAVAAGVANAL
ncbi:interferon alpha-inducible protein 27-like protein 2A isoform X2 [Macrobrachium nipponense]|uniref:interferon alpha-inducible protein 27-like protein 2A isoform X2 n=1 Tax=Macrobrachium nipponense TaxID=159736 RepID=UPI0030C8BFEF